MCCKEGIEINKGKDVNNIEYSQYWEAQSASDDCKYIFQKGTCVCVCKKVWKSFEVEYSQEM
jgi:hypothetical protein